MHPCAGAMLFMELQTATHVFVHEASVTIHVGKSGVFKSSWDLFDDEPHSRNFEVEGKYMWPHPWFNAVLLPLPLHFKAYIFEIKNISLGPTGSLTERRLRSASRGTVRSLAQLVWFQIHPFQFQVLSCHPISLHVRNSAPTE